jgi:hypothetical protein
MALPSSTTSITANFPFPVLTAFASDLQPPTHASLYVLQRELNANAMSVHSHEGGGAHGHLTLTITAARYAQVSQIPFPAPPAPPPHPVLPQPATAVQAAEIHRNHAESHRAYQTYHSTDKALVRCIIAATPETYIETLCDVDFGYATVTTLQLLQHLHTTYGTLTPADREANRIRMITPWSPAVPIETMFKQLEEGQRFAAVALEPIADSQLAYMGYQLVLKTGMFTDGCRDWSMMPDANRTWQHFKTHFARQDRDRLELATAANTGFGGNAFSIQLPPTVPPVDPLLTPQPTASAALALPTGAALVALLVELRNLRLAAAKPPAKAPPGKPTTARGYCWTHGSTSNATHSSSTCKNKAPGHIDSATWRNQQGGNPNTYVPRRSATGTPAL